MRKSVQSHFTDIQLEDRRETEQKRVYEEQQRHRYEEEQRQIRIQQEQRAIEERRYAEMLERQRYEQEQDELRRQEDLRRKREEAQRRYQSNGHIPMDNMPPDYGGYREPNHPTEYLARSEHNLSHHGHYDDSQDSRWQPKRGLRRMPANNAIDPVYEMPPRQQQRQEVESVSQYEYDQPHFRRVLPPNPFKTKDSSAFYQSILDESIEKFQQLDTEVWCKVLYMEQEQVVAKFYLRSPVVTIDGSKHEFDGERIGLGAFDNPLRDPKTVKIRDHIGKGITLELDGEGSLVVTQKSKNDIIVKGYKDPSNHSISAEVLENMGRLKQDTKVKVFDMKEFKSHIALELQKPMPDERKLERQIISSLAFVRNTLGDLDTPCWLCILNLAALDALGDEKILREVQSLAHLQISEKDLKRTWSKMSVQQRKERQKALYQEPLRKSRIELRQQNKKVEGNMDYSWDEKYYLNNVPPSDRLSPNLESQMIGGIPSSPDVGFAPGMTPWHNLEDDTSSTATGSPSPTSTTPTQKKKSWAKFKFLKKQKS